MELAARPRRGSVATRAWTGLCRLNAELARAAKALVVMLTAVMVLSIVGQVATRALLSRSPPWTEEVALLMFTWIVLLMMAICTREHLHVRVDSLIALMPAPVARLAEALISLLVAFIGCYLLWAGSIYLLEMRGSTSQAIRYPSELLYAAMPVASALLLLFALENTIRGARTRADKLP